MQRLHELECLTRRQRNDTANSAEMQEKIDSAGFLG